MDGPEQVSPRNDPPSAVGGENLDAVQMPNVSRRSAQAMLEAERTKWVTFGDRSIETVDRFGSMFADKIKVLCEGLEGLVDEKAVLTVRQEGLVVQAIHSLANKTQYEDLQDMGDAAVVALPLAAYINSCR